MKRLLALVLLAACGTTPGSGTGTGSGDDLGTPENPVPQQGDEGPYQLASNVDLTVEAILPAQAEAVVEQLRDFSTNPAHALITLADASGVPAVGTLYGALPGILKDKLEGWINGEIDKVQIAGHPVTDYAGEIAALADTALTTFGLASELTVDGDHATHTLTAIDFNPAGFDVHVSLAAVPGDLLTQTPTITVGAAGAMTLGDQHFGLAYGEYAWRGINLAVKATTGADIRTTLGNAVNCPHLASVIANKCVLGVCVGHEAELTSICEGGLDALVNTVHDRLAAMRFDVFHFASGAGHMVDDDQDGIADRIETGTWDAELNLGMGLRHTPAAFTGTR